MKQLLSVDMNENLRGAACSPADEGRSVTYAQAWAKRPWVFNVTIVCVFTTVRPSSSFTLSPSATVTELFCRMLLIHQVLVVDL